MAAPGTLTFNKGTTSELSFVYKASGVAVDLTGKVVVFHYLKRGATADTLALSSASAPNVNGSFLAITNAVAGAFSLKLTDEETALMTIGTGTWWISLESGGDIRLIGKGATVVKNVTP